MAKLQADGYRPLDETALNDVLATIPALVDRLGGNPDAWSVESLSGGNLNRIFAVAGPAGSVCTKQALPYMRLLGPDAPMPLDRIVFEQRTRQEHARFAPDRVPEVHHFDPVLRLVVMEHLSGHRELRHALIGNQPLPRVAADLGEYIADVLFHTSALTLSAAECRRFAATMADNTGMYKFLEDLSFTEPYMDHPRNTWNAPYLDGTVEAFHTDAALKVAVGRLKRRFMGAGEALLHGDLHTGSVLVTDDDTRMIDFELSLYGPMGCDLGTLFARTFMNFFGQDGLSDHRRAGQQWTLGFVAEVWQRFTSRCTQLRVTRRGGDAYPADWFGNDDAASRAALDDLLKSILADALGFTGTEMVRRIIGLAQVDDLEQIADPALRARCERRALHFACQLILGAATFENIAAVCRAAEKLRSDQ
ncbi:MAG: S-methyl-5-thioribose kinase [Hyphomicrobiales bacterium]|nr:S-methyl-5-thioribose kinase [Hyphomicrobiales bacterium]